MNIGEETGSMPEEIGTGRDSKKKVVFKESNETAKSRLADGLAREIYIRIGHVLEREGGYYRDWESLYEGHKGRPASRSRSIGVKIRKEAIRKALSSVEASVEKLVAPKPKKTDSSNEGGLKCPMLKSK